MHKLSYMKTDECTLMEHTDINECSLDDTLCKKDREICINLPGSFKCECESGYRYNQNRYCEGLSFFQIYFGCEDCDPLYCLIFKFYSAIFHNRQIITKEIA